MRLDHVAIVARDIAEGVNYYVSRFGAEVLYQDETWAFLKMGGSKLALVKAEQHPPHLALSVTEPELAVASAESGIPVDSHRDGTRGIYLRDPTGNAIELISYPPGQTVYTKK